MRIAVVASALGVAALVGLGALSGPADAAKTKLGCERGKEKWNATLGRCEAGRSKYAKVASKGAPKKAAAKKEMKKKDK